MITRTARNRRWVLFALPTTMLIVAHPTFAQVVPAAATAVAVPQSLDWEKGAGGTQQFEVASIRPTPEGAFTPPTFPMSNDDSYTGGPNQTLNADFSVAVYIEFAYKLRLSPDQRKVLLADAPQWITNQNYEIRAKASGPVTKDQLRMMMQSLLADRFNLAVHFERRDSPVLTLNLARPGKLGPNLRAHADGPPCDQPDDKVFPSRCYVDERDASPGGLVKEGSRNNSMDVICHILTSVGRLDHPLVNQTGLSGNYDFTVEWSPKASNVTAADAGAPAEPQGPSFLEALQEQLGMKIASSKAPLEFLILDHIERPSEN